MATMPKALEKTLSSVSFLRKAVELGGIQNWMNESLFMYTMEEKYIQLFYSTLDQSLLSHEEMIETVKRFWRSLGDGDPESKEYQTQLDGYLAGFEHIIALEFNKKFMADETQENFIQRFKELSAETAAHLRKRILQDEGDFPPNLISVSVDIDTLKKSLQNLPKRLAFYSVRSTVAIRHLQGGDLEQQVFEARNKILKERSVVIGSYYCYSVYNRFEYTLMKEVKGVKLTRWVSDGYTLPKKTTTPCMDCIHQDLNGWRTIDDPSLTIPPVHPNCRCILAYLPNKGDSGANL
jgi:hypothetical protein